MGPLKTYEDVLVSSVPYDFERRPYWQVPRQVLADWAALIGELARLFHPTFRAPELTETAQFRSETIDSDGPYGSSESYYKLSYVSFDLLSPDGTGVRVAFEEGRIEGGEPLEIGTLGLHPRISSYIDKGSRSPRARIFVFHDDAMDQAVQTVLKKHSNHLRPPS